MKCINLLLLVCTGFITIGCQTNTAKRQHIPSEVSTSGPTEGRPTLGMPIALPDSDIFVVPFTIDRPRRWLEDSDQFETSKSMAPSSPVSRHYEAEAYGGTGMSRTVRWHNAVIGSSDGKGELVLDRRGVISRLEVVGPWVEVEDEDRDKDDPIEYRFVPKAVLMLATVADTDKDDQLTNADANVLLAGDPKGAGLHAITPDQTQVWSTHYNDKQNLILIMVASDTNDDGLFTIADSAAPYVYTPGDSGKATPLVDPALVEQAERLLK